MDIDNKQLERDIENAIRARGLKEQMQQWDMEASAERSLEDATLQDGSNTAYSIKKSEQKITPWPKIRRTIYSLSAVAAIVGILVMTIPASTWQDTFNQLSRWGYKQYAQYFRKTQPIQKVDQYDTQTLMAMVEKSAKEISNSYYEQEILGHENPLHEVVWQILRGDYAVAQMILDEQLENLDPDDATYQDTIEDIQYLQALCELGLNHLEKAKKALREIANSPSKHSQQAAELLKTAW